MPATTLAVRAAMALSVFAVFLARAAMAAVRAAMGHRVGETDRNGGPIDCR